MRSRGKVRQWGLSKELWMPTLRAIASPLNATQIWRAKPKALALRLGHSKQYLKAMYEEYGLQILRGVRSWLNEARFGGCRVLVAIPRHLNSKGGLAEKNGHTYLYSRLERQVGIARVAHFEDAPESVFRQVADFEDLKIRGHGAQIELGDEDVIDNDGRFWRLVQGLCQKIAGAGVEVLVSRERRPVEVEGHIIMAFFVARPWRKGLSMTRWSIGFRSGCRC